MAKIHEEVVVIKLSKLVKNDEDGQTLTADDFEANLEAIIQELVGATVMVEVEKA